MQRVMTYDAFACSSRLIEIKYRLLLEPHFRALAFICPSLCEVMNGRACIAITGTPGTGKTALCQELEGVFTVLSLQDLAEKHACIGPQDTADGAAPVDIHQLSERWEYQGDGITFIDGHLSHFLEVDALVLLRCNPVELKQRLQSRDYLPAKVTANVEWELLSGTWAELLEFEISLPLLELDTTSASPQELHTQVLSWIEKKFPSQSLQESSSQAIDWM